VQLRVVRVPVQQQVHQARLAQQPVEVVGVTQVLVVPDRAAHRVVVHGGQPEPAPGPVASEPISEPPQLVLSDPPVVVSVAVALRHGGVQSRHHHSQVRHLEQRPRFVRSERGGFHAVVEVLEGRDELPPLGPVRRDRFGPVALLLGEVRRAGLPVDVVVARHEGDVPPGDLGRLRERRQELGNLPELAPQPPLGQVARDDQ
jgi:hypothetical protein